MVCCLCVFYMGTECGRFRLRMWIVVIIVVIIVYRKMKLEFLENPSSTLLGFSRISNLFQAHFWDFF